MSLTQLLGAALLLTAVLGTDADAADTIDSGITAVPALSRTALQPAEPPDYLAKRPDVATRDSFVPSQERAWYLQVLENVAIGTASNVQLKETDGRPRTPTTPRP